MSGIQTTTTTQQTTIIQQTTQQVTVQHNEPPRPAVLPDESEAARQLLEDTYARTSRPSKPAKLDTPTQTIKLLGGGALLGGSASALASMGAKAAFTESFHKPTAAGVGLGVALGTGIALANLETGDKTLNAAKNTAAGLLIGGSTTGMVGSAAGAIFTERLQPVSGKSVLLGATLGGGIALANLETDDNNLKAAKNAAAGLMIGAGTTGIATGFAKSVFTEYLHSASTPTILMGAALGGGIALANTELDNKGLNTAKNTAAGALIGTGVAGLGSAFIKTIAAERLAGASPIAMGVAAALGAGIGLLASDE